MNIYSCVVGDERMKEKNCQVCKTTSHMEEAKNNMLSSDDFEYLGMLFKTLGDPTRLKILAILFKDELCVHDICKAVEMSQSAVSHQLAVLRQNRIIKARREGKNVFYSFDDQHIQMIYNAGMEHILE